MILIFAALLGITQAPLLLVAAHPDTPIAIPLRWLRGHFSHDTANLIYALGPLGITLILIYAIIVYDYIRHEASDLD